MLSPATYRCIIRADCGGGTIVRGFLVDIGRLWLMAANRRRGALFPAEPRFNFDSVIIDCFIVESVPPETIHVRVGCSLK
jgi:hypothetical protein